MKFKEKLILLFISVFLTFPVLVFSVTSSTNKDYSKWVFNVMQKIITPVWQFFAGITVIMFIVAGILFVTSNGDPGKITTAKSAVIWGVVGIIVATLAFIIVQTVSSWV